MQLFKTLTHRITLPGAGLAATLCIVHLAAGPSGAQNAATFIGQLQKPGTGNDSAARTGLRKLTHDTFRPNAEGERASHEAALLAGLSGRPDWEVKAFLLEDLAIQAKGPAVDPIAAWLGDANLCEFAAMALIGIQSTEKAAPVAAPIRAALAKATGRCKTALMQAAGALRDADPATVDILVKEAAAADKNVRMVALRALANIGDAKAKAAMAGTLNGTDLWERYQAVSLNLLFALRLGERGLRSDGLAIANAIKAAATADEPHVTSHAQFTIDSLNHLPVSLRAAQKARGLAIAAGDGGLELRMDGEGEFRFRIMDVTGRTRRELRGRGAGPHGLSLGALPPGMYRMIFEDAAGVLDQGLVRF